MSDIHRYLLLRPSIAWASLDNLRWLGACRQVCPLPSWNHRFCAAPPLMNADSGLRHPFDQADTPVATHRHWPAMAQHTVPWVRLVLSTASRKEGGPGA